MEVVVTLGLMVAFAAVSYFLGVDSREWADERPTVEQRPRRAI